jgi:hypothetical protein
MEVQPYNVVGSVISTLYVNKDIAFMVATTNNCPCFISTRIHTPNDVRSVRGAYEKLTDKFLGDMMLRHRVPPARCVDEVPELCTTTVPVRSFYYMEAVLSGNVVGMNLVSVVDKDCKSLISFKAPVAQ